MDSTASPGESRVRLGLAAGLIALAAFAAYHNSFSAPFIFDDRYAVVENPTIRHVSTAFFPPDDNGSGVRGRPLVNLSFALNYAVGGLDVRGYHAVNLLIHVAAALALYGVVWRTLRRPPLQVRFGMAAQPLALAAAVIWAVHPLLTEPVVCVAHRTESLASLFYLLTLYGFVRATEPVASSRWLAGSVAACLLGVTAKETVATAPLLMVLYDYAFVSGSLAEAWRRRRGFYLALAVTWLPLGALVVGAQGRGGTAGFGLGISWWEYAFTQCWAVVHYAWLAVWPHPLVVDYGENTIKEFSAIWPQALVLAGLMGGTVWALRRRPAPGFLGAWFFVILAPSSSVLPVVTQAVAERRMYLPLAALVLGAVLGGYAWLGRRSLSLCGAWAVALAAGTVARNETYRTGVSIWADAVAHRPANARAHNNLAVELLELNRLTEAEPELREALRLAPDYTDARLNLGQLLLTTRRPAEAVPEFERVLRRRLEPPVASVDFATRDRVADVALATFGLGSAVAALGRSSEAVSLLEKAALLQPETAMMQAGLANALAAVGRRVEAMAHFETALRLDPDSAETHFNFGLLRAQMGNFVEAQRELGRALELKPDYAEARAGLDQLRDHLRRAPAAR